MRQLHLIDAPMSRRTDPDTSHEAAEVVKPRVGKIAAEVLAAFRELGAMTAREVEELPRWEGRYHRNTIRRRITDLRKDGRVVAWDVDRTGKAPATIWRAVDE